MIEQVQVNDRTVVSIWKKVNPLWWMVGDDGWTAPLINNGTPYLPGVTNQLLRNFYWFWRNPMMNFVGYVLGVGDKNYKAVGLAPVMLTTLRDVIPPRTGATWAVLFPTFSLGALVVSVIVVALVVFVHWAFALVLAFSLFKIIGPLPYVSYYNRTVEFYLGWRPYSGGYGLKIVFPKNGG